MFTKSRGITVPKYTYNIILIGRSKKEKTNVSKAHTIMLEVEYEDHRNIDFAVAIAEGIEDVYEKLEGGKE